MSRTRSPGEHPGPQSMSKPVMFLAPLWFCAVILFAGAFTPGYSHSFQAVSELAAPGAPYAGLVRFGGFIPLGLAFLLFSFAVRQMPGSKAFQTAAFILFALTGLAIIAAGIFPTDVHGRRNSFSGMAHAVAGLALLVLLCTVPLLAAASPALRSGRRGFRIYSLFSGVLLVTLFILLPNGISPALIQLQKNILGDLFAIWYKYQGLDQRALLLVYFAWLSVFVQLFMGKSDGRRV
jgi:hypothetical membrane protein